LKSGAAMETTVNTGVRKTVMRTLDVIRLKKGEIYSIYFFAAMYGVIQLSIPLGIQMIVNFIQAYTFSTSLWVLIALVLVGVLCSGALQVTQMRIIERINQKIFSRYALEFAYRIPKLDVKAVDDYYLPELVNRFFDTVGVQKGLGKLLIDIPMASIQIVFGIILLSFYSSVFIVFGITLFIILSLIIYFTSKRGIETNNEESNYKYAVAGWLEEMARAFKTFKFSVDANMHLKESDRLVSNYLDARTNHFKVLLTQYWSLIGFKFIITATMLIMGAVLAINNQINIGQFVAAEIVILMIMASVEKFVFSLDVVYDLLTSVDKLNKVLEKPLQASGSIPFSPAEKGIEVKLKDLSFGFYTNNRILHNISAHIPPGNKVCIIGSEGAGKSLLLRMLTGAYNDYTGSVLLNNIPIHNYDQRSLHQHTGIILNDQDIFHGTVLNNITLGNSAISMQNVTKLASITQFDHYISNLTNGYNTVLDVAGKRLSKSTIQKILIMRALVHKPGLLLLENPWSALNEDNKESIQRYILNELNDTTVIVAANDTAFARKCDQVIIMEHGSIRAMGKTNEVLEFLS
jgi:ABC-type bacteriocin/lantibiotic exporter with double-glycine peptidase domain